MQPPAVQASEVIQVFWHAAIEIVAGALTVLTGTTSPSYCQTLKPMSNAKLAFMRPPFIFTLYQQHFWLGIMVDIQLIVTLESEHNIFPPYLVFVLLRSKCKVKIEEINKILKYT
ncbi:MAG: hypothetical protein CME31_14280 [Gimesia sp.]|uniref:Uncharacterized protein n=1 Tax=Gimesia maris TaxID=122 RepID=A0A3D3R9F6_9PLAN|nr:hypothetical protein [Gimesia sp.]HCO25491.1 hypothetical protein [Gimesia maris]